MNLEWWFQVVKDGGAVAAILELGALVWLNVDRNRLISENKAKDTQLSNLSERMITVMTELKTFLFSRRG